MRAVALSDGRFAEARLRMVKKKAAPVMPP